MSKFLDHLRAIRPGKKMALRDRCPMVTARMEVDPASSMRVRRATEYVVGVEVGTRVLISDEEIERTGGALETHVIKNIQAQIAEIIYRDVRTGIHSMWNDLYSLRRDGSLEQWATVERLESTLNQILADITP